jgi:hypothetical protein
MDTYGLKLKKVTYDADANTIEVDINYQGFLPIKMVLKHQSLVAHGPYTFTLPTMPLLGGPSGAYTGASSAFGTTLDGEFDVSGSSMDIHLTASGTFSLNLDCSGVGFSLSGSTVEGVTSNSCIKSALDSNGCSVKSFAYSGDEFTLTLAKSIL